MADTNKKSTWNKNNVTLGYTYNTPKTASSLGTTYKTVTPLVNNTVKGVVTDKVSKAPTLTPTLQSYGTVAYSSGGGSGSGDASVSAQSVYDASKEAYQKAYDAAVSKANTAYQQNLKTLLDDWNRTQEDIATQKSEYKKYYDTQASNLLKSIERFRDENAQNVADQRRSYLTNQAALESARAEADRQSRISAAARGLGGSGLQQLAQLQNLINQSQEISNVATENQTNMDKLRKALAQAEEDYNENLAKSEDARKTDLDKLDTELKRAKEDYKTNTMNAENNLRDLLAGYEASKASNDVSALNNLYSMVNSRSSGSGSSTDINPTLSFLTEQFQSDLDSIGSMTDKELKNTYGTSNKTAIYNNLLNTAKSEAVNAGVGSSNYSTLNSNLAALLAARQQEDENNKKPTLWQRLFG